MLSITTTMTSALAVGVAVMLCAVGARAEGNGYPDEHHDGYGYPDEHHDGYGYPGEHHDGYGYPGEHHDGYGYPGEHYSGYGSGYGGDHGVVYTPKTFGVSYGVWWKPWTWTSKSHDKNDHPWTYDDDYKYTYTPDSHKKEHKLDTTPYHPTQYELERAAHNYVGLSETLKQDSYTTERGAPPSPQNSIVCTCGCKVEDISLSCISILLDPNNLDCYGNQAYGNQADEESDEFDESESGESDESGRCRRPTPTQTVYQPVGYGKYIGTSQMVTQFGRRSDQTTFTGRSLEHKPGGALINTIVSNVVPANRNKPVFPFTEVRKQGPVTCDVYDDHVKNACNRECVRLNIANKFYKKCIGPY